MLSAGKKLLDTKHPAYKAVSSVKSRINSYWKSETLPFPQTGIRLIRQDSVEAFNERLGEFQQELEQAVSRLDDEFSELKFAARDRLGDLFNEADYPPSLNGLFSVTWGIFPTLKSPNTSGD